MGSDLSFAAKCTNDCFAALADTALANNWLDCFGEWQMRTIRFEPYFVAEMRYETWYEDLIAQFLQFIFDIYASCSAEFTSPILAYMRVFRPLTISPCRSRDIGM